MERLLILLCLLFSNCPKTENAPLNIQTLNTEKILIVYLSRTNNTKAVAKIIQQKIGGKLVALKKQNPYPENYQEIVTQVVEENKKGFLPPLKTKTENIEDYDVVFVGFPTWDMQMPPPIKTFLSENDFSGKIIIPFNTNAGYGVGNGFEQLKQLCQNSTILKGFTVEGGYEKKGVFLAIKEDREEKVEQQVYKWLRDIEIL